MDVKTNYRLDNPNTGTVAPSLASGGASVGRGGPPDNALSYELGVTRLFGIGDIGKRGLVKGWAPPEDGHVWNDGPDAELLITMPVPSRTCLISVEGSPFIRPRQPQQEVTMFANGFRLGFLRFKEAVPQMIFGNIEPEHFLLRGKLGVLRLTWHLPNSIRPSEIEGSADGRELGFVFRSLKIELS